MKAAEGILFIITGGTIDSYYEGTKDTVIPSAESIIPEVMNLVRSDTPIEFKTVCMKDSRELSEDDLRNILKIIEESEHSKIIVTHGTYTMPDTARFLKAHLPDSPKTVVVVGSLLPIKGFSPSDGPFNIGYAMGKIEDLKQGVYVAMNAHIFDPEEVAKRVSEGRFVSILGE